ncbi:MAG: transcriptional repressor [Coriobacteriales bacterium]|jgi:Fur family ferric uptake transcriptional regulator
MADRRRTYRTRQRALIEGCLSRHADRYLSVDDVVEELRADGSPVGRTTVYRNLEALAGDGALLKATAPGAGESRYRLAPPEPVGQLVCLSCGRAMPLDCRMLVDFAAHVRSHHGFTIDESRTVLYGTCDACAKRGGARD